MKLMSDLKLTFRTSIADSRLLRRSWLITLQVAVPCGHSRLWLAFRFAQVLRTVPHGSALVFG